MLGTIKEIQEVCSKCIGKKCFGVGAVTWALKDRLDLDYMELERKAEPLEYKGLEARNRQAGPEPGEESG